MLKRKRGKTTSPLSPNKSTISIRNIPKKTKLNNHHKGENGYEQTTLSQTFLKKPPAQSPKLNKQIQPKIDEQNFPPQTLQTYRLYPEIEGIIRSYLKVYIKKLKDKNFFALEEPQKSIIIEGPSGCGKTFLIKSLCEELGLRILELGVSHNRNSAQTIKILSEATQTYALTSGEVKNIQGSIILLDDVDIVLEPDKGFHKSVSDLLGSNRNPIIMTCQCSPKIFRSHDNVKVCRIERSPEKVFGFIKWKRDELKLKLSDEELEVLCTHTKANLHALLNAMKLIRPLDLIGWDNARLIPPNSVEIVKESKANMLESEMLNFIENNSTSIYLGIDEYVNWLEGLEEIDILNLFSKNIQEKENPILNECSIYSGTMAYMQYLSDYFMRNQESTCRCKLQEIDEEKSNLTIVREHLAHMGDPTDYIGYFQEISKMSCDVEPSYYLRTKPKLANLMSIFLQRNPNLFRT
ncbi:unnamed protein product [Blepharisma stoltei]|uniref:AAA+ ATPase domain-containing protein n=1 Tax=Blepharisma stoltei TaxID=1481888 RepID=A0AAU9IFX2_9CILI|nr:unnamed protein product [Blepharisma stoltei]